VLAGLMEGETQTDIARRLHLSPHYVSHLARSLMLDHDAVSTATMVAVLWAARCAVLEARVADRDATIVALQARLAARHGGRRADDQRP
jgi:hypothetical protein